MVGSTCKDSTGLVSEMMDHRVSIIKHWKVKFHLSICEFCRHYKEQLETLRGLTQKLEKDTPEMEDQGTLKAFAKERMKRLLDEKK